MARCRDEGRSASEALRGFIDGELDAPRPGGRGLGRILVGAAIAAAMGAVALPSLARRASGPTSTAWT